MMRTPLHLLFLAISLVPLVSQADDSSLSAANEIETGVSRDALNNGYANWKSFYLDGSHRFGARHSVYGELRETRRFDLHDREIFGGYYHPLGESWTALVEASASPDHRVLPQDSLFGQLQKTFDGGWDVQAGLRRSRYNTASASLATLTGERYWSDFRVAYNLYLSTVPGAGRAPNHNAQFSYYYSGTGRDYMTVSFAKGRQLESLGANLGVLITDITSTSLSGRHWFSPVWGLSYEATVEHQGNLYTRKGIRFGLRHAY